MTYTNYPDCPRWSFQNYLRAANSVTVATLTHKARDTRQRRTVPSVCLHLSGNGIQPLSSPPADQPFCFTWTLHRFPHCTPKASPHIPAEQAFEIPQCPHNYYSLHTEGKVESRLTLTLITLSEEPRSALQLLLISKYSRERINIQHN